MTTLASDTFTGSDGSAWSSTWTTGETGNPGGSATIQGNMGRLGTGTNGSYNGLDRTSRRANIAAGADVEISGLFKCDATEAYGSVYVRADNALDTQTGYSLSLDKTGTLGVGKSVAYALTNLGMISFTATAGIVYGFRLRVVGTSVQARVWSGAEPATWDISVTDSEISAAGAVGITVGGGAAAAASYFFIDDITITDGASGGGAGTATYRRLPVTGYYDTSRYQSLIVTVRAQEAATLTAPAAYGTLFLYHFDAAGGLIDEQVMKFFGDNGYPLASGFLCYLLAQIPSIGASTVAYIVFDTVNIPVTLSITGSYRQLDHGKAFNGGGYFGASCCGTIGGGGIDGYVSWTATVPASTTWRERPYCWTGPALLTVSIDGAIASPGVDVYLATDFDGVAIAGQRSITCTGAQILTYNAIVPAAPVQLVIKNNTSGAIPAISVSLTTALGA